MQSKEATCHGDGLDFERQVLMGRLHYEPVSILQVAEEFLY